MEEGKLWIRKEIPATIVLAFKAAAQAAGENETQYLIRLLKADQAAITEEVQNDNSE